ncbi:MAG TPA: multidrug effflux MFS transporter [Beijerinckiaceae bacterium]|nr:multidrug effflux MFS transporter [Beijerinckiaceae bacterium]
MHQQIAPNGAVETRIGFKEFVAMVAALMALNALAIDIMLPGLQEIGNALDVADENRRQAVLTAYLWAFGVGQLLVGSVSDRFGRKPVLLGGLALYIVAAALCAAATSFEALLVARALQGLASAAPRVVVTAVVRDCYGGRRMASVMSLAMMAFISVPVLAPSIGQLVLLFSSWREIFGLLTLYGLVLTAWTWRRLPETLPPDRRRPASPRGVALAIRKVLTTRQTIGYTLATGMMFGANFGFIVTAQQIFVDVFGLGVYFPLAFAAVAVTMALSSFINSRLVVRLGMRRISHGAVVLFTALSGTLLALAAAGALKLWMFMLLIAGIMFLLGMVFSNFNALAMEPQAGVAGTASSLTGSITTVMAASLGHVTGQAYDGTAVPLGTSYLVLGLATLLIILVTERGRLFDRARTSAPGSAARSAPPRLDGGAE